MAANQNDIPTGQHPRVKRPNPKDPPTAADIAAVAEFAEELADRARQSRHAIKGDIHTVLLRLEEIAQTLADLANAIRGGDGGPGIAGRLAKVEDRLEAMVTEDGRIRERLAIITGVAIVVPVAISVLIGVAGLMLRSAGG